MTEDKDTGTDWSISSDRIYYKNVYLDGIKSVFLRNISFSVPFIVSPFMSQLELKNTALFALMENMRLNNFFDMLNMLSSFGALIINRPETYFHHNAKGSFYHILKRNGASCPESLNTANSNQADKFKKNSQAIVKAATGIGATSIVKKNKINNESLSLMPALFQKRVNGQTIRVHTVGTRVFLLCL
jgi:glutathione synthase/RimK-type ligase-like ATP-grasp enzyme